MVGGWTASRASGGRGHFRHECTSGRAGRDYANVAPRPAAHRAPRAEQV